MINTETQQCWRCREQKTIGHSFLNRTLILLPPPSKGRRSSQKRGWEDCNGQGLLGWLTRKQHLLDAARQLSRWTHSSSVTACTRHGQAQPDHIPARTEEVDIKLHPSPRSDWQPLASGRGRVRFFPRVYPSICQPRSSGRPHIQNCFWRTKWPWWGKIGHKVVWEGKGVDLGSAGGRKLSAIYMLHKFTCYIEFSKN